MILKWTHELQPVHGDKLDVYVGDLKTTVTVVTCMTCRDGTFEVALVLYNKDETWPPKARASNCVFVWGFQVTDFRNVSYDDIAILNVSATQKLYNLLQDQADQIKSLKADVVLLKSKLHESPAN